MSHRFPLAPFTRSRHSPCGVRLCRSIPIGSIPAGNGFHDSASLRHIRNVRELGFDACVDYKSADARDAFTAATADGVDVLFENVGGMVFDMALGRMNVGGRVALCGLIAGYDGQDIAIRNVRSILINRLSVTGFIVSDHAAVWPQALQELSGHVAAGRLKYRESITTGIENAPKAFIGLLKGENFGKQLVKL